MEVSEKLLEQAPGAHIKIWQSGKRVKRLASGVELQELVTSRPVLAHKMFVFQEAGYTPHPAQIYFHLSSFNKRISGAGRRSGKTKSCSVEFAYLSHPDWQRAALHELGVSVYADPDDPNHLYQPDDEAFIYFLVVPDLKNHKRAIRDYKIALEKFGINYNHNKQDGAIYIGREPHPTEATATTIVYIKPGDGDEKSFRGEGVTLAWWDEPAFIKGNKQWEAFEPALTDFNGAVIASTSPGEDESQWWFYDEFIDPEGMADDVEYFQWTSLDNPFLKREFLKKQWKKKHPLIFRREYLAVWERGAGEKLKFDWLKYFKWQGEDGEKGDIKLLDSGKPDPAHYEFHMAADPTLTANSDSDYFALWVIATDKETGQSYLVDYVHEKLDIGQQIDKIKEKFYEWNPLLTGVESNAAGQYIIEQVERIAGMPSIWPIRSGTNKEMRLMALGPIMRAGSVRINKDDHADLIQEWIDFPNGKNDDLLDALDMAIRTARVTGHARYEAESEDEDKKDEKLNLRQIRTMAILQEEGEWEEEDDYGAYYGDWD